jgi:hypothetical protein
MPVVVGEGGRGGGVMWTPGGYSWCGEVEAMVSLCVVGLKCGRSCGEITSYSMG